MDYSCLAQGTEREDVWNVEPYEKLEKRKRAQKVEPYAMLRKKGKEVQIVEP